MDTEHTILLKQKDRSVYLSFLLSSREDRIRTCDTLVPNQVLYQAELLPELNRKMHPRGVEPLTA